VRLFTWLFGSGITSLRDMSLAEEPCVFL